MANLNATKQLARATRCSLIRVDLVVPNDVFDIGPLARAIPTEGDWDVSTEALSGPLRMGGRGHDEFRISGTSALHGEGGEPHYHFSVYGSLAKKPFKAAKSIPTVRAFFGAIAEGIHGDSKPLVTVVGQHRYPREWWTGDTLPVPLPARDGKKDYGAQLSGVEITYEGDAGTERLMVSALSDDMFGVATVFQYTRVDADLFGSAIQRSADLATRMFVEPSDTSE
ncbi:hypothetical protein [Longimicrobium sp.]|uniref:hypothetical protein n=1 Tax=Longimicrobium sp. TaxID=2029185 RepID=UPI002ED98C32